MVQKSSGSRPDESTKIKVLNDMIDNLNGIERDRDNLANMPDQKYHQIVSFAKSGVRLMGYGLLLYSLEFAVGVLILSEVIGIVEELV